MCNYHMYIILNENIFSLITCFWAITLTYITVIIITKYLNNDFGFVSDGKLANV